MSIRAFLSSVTLAATAVLAVPSFAAAQATIAGIARDTSGSVLPGVTVEAASPALIEKVRSVVTDGAGQFRIVDLRPGVYSVTFTLAGFSSVRRDAVTLEGAATVSVNADMRVGAVEETILVTGEAAVVDVQTVTQQRVLNKDTLEALPTGRSLLGFATLMPGVNPSEGAGAMGFRSAVTLSVHGSRGADTRLTIDGLSISDAQSTGSQSSILPNMAAVQEVVVDTAALGADEAGGGVRVNVIPREGGNLFKGTAFITETGSALQGDNVTDELRERGLRNSNSLSRIYDYNGGLGGPIARDRLWFYGAARFTGNETFVGGMYEDRNRGRADLWTWDPDFSRQATQYIDYRSVQLRLTYQASAKNKFSFMHDQQSRELSFVSATSTPEAQYPNRFPSVAQTAATWSSPMTTRLLVDAGYQRLGTLWYNLLPEPGSDLYSQIGVVEQSTGISYRGRTGSSMRNPQVQNMVRASVAYVTGSHQLKVGFTDRSAWRRAEPGDTPFAVAYRFNNGVPNQITQRAVANTVTTAKTIADYAIYAQDRWTMKRMTLNLAVRFEGVVTHTSPGTAGPTRFAPNRNVTFEEQAWGNTKDLTPRLGVVYDLFGNGRTALKASANKYVTAAGLGGFDPVASLPNSVTRGWADANRNYIPDCDLMVLTANGECAQASNLNFGGTTAAAAIAPVTARGWGKREFNWEVSAGVQHALSQRMSVNAAYFRRWYGNFLATDNRAVGAADYTSYSIMAPADSRLPGGGGNVIGGFVDLNPNKVGQVSNLTTFSKEFGKQIEHWNGVDLGVDARLRQGLMLQGGISTGRTSTDNCEIVAVLPEMLAANSAANCHVDTKFLTQAKLIGSYAVPVAGLQVSATFQNLPGPQILANFTATNALVAPSLGRNLSGGATTNLSIVKPGTLYGDRVNQLDLRIGRPFAFGSRRVNLSIDIFNALNVSPVTLLNNAYASWQVPQAVLDARYAKFTFQFDF